LRVSRCFGGTYRINLQGRGMSRAMNRCESSLQVGSFETSVIVVNFVIIVPDVKLSPLSRVCSQHLTSGLPFSLRVMAPDGMLRGCERCSPFREGSLAGEGCSAQSSQAAVLIRWSYPIPLKQAALLRTTGRDQVPCHWAIRTWQYEFSFPEKERRWVYVQAYLNPNSVSVLLSLGICAQKLKFVILFGLLALLEFKGFSSVDNRLLKLPSLHTRDELSSVCDGMMWQAFGFNDNSNYRMVNLMSVFPCYLILFSLSLLPFLSMFSLILQFFVQISNFFITVLIRPSFPLSSRLYVRLFHLPEQSTVFD
jgi:hypothetical protein